MYASFNFNVVGVGPKNVVSFFFGLVSASVFNSAENKVRIIRIAFSFIFLLKLKDF